MQNTTQELTQAIDDWIEIEQNKYISQSAVTEPKMDRTIFSVVEYYQKNQQFGCLLSKC